MNILITNAEWKSALTCMRSLAKKGHRISLLSSKSHSPTLYSKFCKEKIICPDEKYKKDYMSFLNELIKDRKYDFLIPISDLSVEYCSEDRDEILKHVKMLLPSKNGVIIARSKDQTYRFAQNNGIPIPDTYFPQSWQDIEHIANVISFPCVVKESNKCAGDGNKYIDSMDKLFTSFKNYENLQNWPMVQEFIKGKCYSVTAVCRDGKILDFFMYELVRQYPDTGGMTVYARSYYNTVAFEFLSKLIEKLSWTGAIDVDFFITKDKGFKLLEINPRFGGTTQFAYSCGVDLPLKYFQLAFSNSCNINPTKYKIGMFYRSIFPQEINSCIKNKKHVKSFIKNFFRLNVCYDFSLSDPVLLFQQLKAAKWDIFS